ncbi:acetyltransferase [candidate division TA06 bacterium DG_24]|uniref:Acetyltransferase n=3 Tax=Bacteria division TA06 TaxID=1156500 RepID=A0A0S8JPA3_UNCT6|nr:MAG: acetyltransferase [candidate division TA06 bacterium DG_24]KPK71340.1 MAG: acetyltransferase [candidate division TA06 bacterium SM23_40]KPL10629.1 MAG: acetyltransferase [candidate division TA06 bacterium SM1_40]
MNETYIHPTADVSDKAIVGAGTKVWHQAQVRENAVIGPDCIIGKGVYVDHDVVIGSNVKIQNNVSLYNGVTLADDVFIGPHVTFTNDLYPRSFDPEWHVLPTLVGRGASIGANATIICGVTIGAFAMIGAGAVIAADVPDHGLVYGNPARLRGFACQCGRPVTYESRKHDTVVLLCQSCGERLEVSRELYELSTRPEHIP